MKRSTWIAAMAVAMAFSQTAVAQARTELGKLEFESNCASCHGAGGAGDGYYAQYLKLGVPDLVTIAERNGGVFPADRVQRVIDGREAIMGHGTRTMPIWGVHYTQRAAEYYKGFAYDPEAFTRARIVSLVDYVYAMQSQR